MMSESKSRELVRLMEERDDAARNGRAIRLHPIILAEGIKHQREKRGWKQDILASLANVSLSTIQRAERGERVGDPCLNRIEKVFGLPSGVYTQARVPETLKQLSEIREKLDAERKQSESIKISPLRTYKQISSIVQCRVICMDIELPDESAKSDLEKLKNNIELASLVFVSSQAGILRAIGHPHLKRRELYNDLLALIRSLEDRHRIGIRGGVYQAKMRFRGSEFMDVAILNVRSVHHDPASRKSGFALVPKSLDGKRLWKDFETRMDVEHKKFVQGQAHV